MTGGTGQVATALAAAGGDAVRVVGRPEFDFDRPETIVAVFRAAAPWLVVNAAAYTAVDAAETTPRRRAAPTATGRRAWRGCARRLACR